MQPPRENKSAKMRELFQSGMPIAEIARVMGVRYQYAYNVISHYVNLKKGGLHQDVTGNDRNGSVLLSVGTVG
jgi:DNA invertase Pin-like site-specific DNA recombinase